MEKVIVNKVVASWIEEQRKLTDNDNFWLLYEVIGERDNSNFNENDIDIVILAKAIQYGYEVPYELKVGDIILSEKGFLYRISVNGEESDSLTLEEIKNRNLKYTLVCEKEERRDLK